MAAAVPAGCAADRVPLAAPTHSAAACEAAGDRARAESVELLRVVVCVSVADAAAECAVHGVERRGNARLRADGAEYAGPRDDGQSSRCIDRGVACGVF